MGDDDGAARADILVPAGMVAVPVGVDDEAVGSGSTRPHRGDDPVGEGGELIVDDDIAVLAVGQADIAARAGQDGDAGRDPLDPDLRRSSRAAVRSGRRGEQVRVRR